jgi:hypothetical protein
VEIIGGLVGTGNLVLSLVLGIRLARLARRDSDGPEVWLALYFLVASFLGMGLSNFVYMSWADAAMALPERAATLLNAMYLFGVTAGMGCLYIFTWRTFRPGANWARGLALGVCFAMAVGYVAIGWSGDFALSLIPGTAYWITWALRTSVFVWLMIESLHYWGLMRRRLRLGLVDPLVANRFALWGIWSSVMLAMGQIDPLARVWYVTQIGAGDVWVPELGRPIVLWLVTVSAALGAFAMVTLYLTFFPTRAYHRRVAERAARAGA